MTFEQIWESLWKHGTLAVILGVSGYFFIKGCRVFWADVVIHLRDRLLTRAEAFFTKQETVLDAILRRHDDSARRDMEAGQERERHEDILYKINEKMEEVADTCAQTVVHITGALPPPHARRQLKPQRRTSRTPAITPLPPPPGSAPPPHSNRPHSSGEQSSSPS